jgi:hypothetical protein
MKIDKDKIDDAVLALPWLTQHDGDHACKTFDWGTTGRLYDKGMIGRPAEKAKSAVLSADGPQRVEETFEALFTTPA